MAILPQELFDAIIDEVHEDKKTLKSCAVVASSFLGRSQRNLFRNVVVGRVGLLGDVSITFFADSPYLALYIRHLTIHMVSEFDAIVLALRLAQNIESLFVSGREMRWGKLGNGVPLALFDCLTRQSLRRLRLVRMPDVPAAFMLAVLASVPAVSLFEVRVDSNWQEMEQDSNSSPAPRLRHLLLADIGPLHLRFSDPSTESHIHPSNRAP
ncbi:hypothetical protein C8R45DRAFT_1045616 [Mycena sanguinolenta]|nr:hypothetical protein C8R45DRAFT_1045616 [Mycena sanguinolenta]